MPMKIPVNKIKGWQKPTNCLPVLDKLVIIQKKSDQYCYTLAQLFAGNENVFFMDWEDNGGHGCAINEVARWAYIKV
jgi:hypothetical protein